MSFWRDGIVVWREKREKMCSRKKERKWRRREEEASMAVCIYNLCTWEAKAERKFRASLGYL